MNNLEKIIISLSIVFCIATLFTIHSVLKIRAVIITESAERMRLDAQFRERMLEIAESHGVFIMPEKQEAGE